MCANFESPTPEQLQPLRSPALADPEFTYKRDLYPGSTGPFLAAELKSRWLPGCFGLVPHWAKPALARQTYNARTETVATKPSFRAAWNWRRLAVIPAIAIYEPHYVGEQSARWRIERKDGRPFGIAGIYEHRMEDPGATKWSFSMLTINAAEHPLMNRFHGPEDEKRSIVVLDADAWDDWLTAKREPDIRSLLRLFDPEDFQASPAPRPPRRPATVTA